MVGGGASDAHTVIGRICAKCKLRSAGGPERGYFRLTGWAGLGRQKNVDSGVDKPSFELVSGLSSET